MFENLTFETLMERKLETVSNNLDKREGSVIYDSLAPNSMELANVYIHLDMVMDETFADTASYMYLAKRAAERGIFPRLATNAVLMAEFTPSDIDIPIGARFSLGVHNYAVKERISNGRYQVVCETEGAEGNRYFGKVLPVEYIDGLQYGEITELLIPGEDDENVDAFRNRYFSSFNNEAYGGNRADYKKKVKDIQGVGGVKVYRAWKGGVTHNDILIPDGFYEWLNSASGIPGSVRVWLDRMAGALEEGAVTVGGGCVRLVIIDSGFNVPSQALIDSVQNAIDPPDARGEGNGVAPIGHVVTVCGVHVESVNIKTNIILSGGYLWDDVKPNVSEVIDNYFKELSVEWEESSALIVRISQLETRLLDVPGVIDIYDTILNGKQANLILDTDSIPVRGEISNGQAAD